MPARIRALPGHEVQRQLHGRVFLPSRAPDPDEQVHRQDGDLIEEEEEEQVPGHEHAEHTRW